DAADAHRSPGELLDAENQPDFLGEGRFVEVMQDDGVRHHVVFLIPRPRSVGRVDANEMSGGVGATPPGALFALLTRATLPTRGRDKKTHICRSTSFILSSAMASEGFNPFGQALAQFMMVWQR